MKMKGNTRIGCNKVRVDYQLMLCNIPQEQRPLLHGGSLKYVRTFTCLQHNMCPFSGQNTSQHRLRAFAIFVTKVAVLKKLKKIMSQGLFLTFATMRTSDNLLFCVIEFSMKGSPVL
jgi:hypothetical protein